jgi:hypothetical protein
MRESSTGKYNDYIYNNISNELNYKEYSYLSAAKSMLKSKRTDVIENAKNRSKILNMNQRTTPEKDEYPINIITLTKNYKT